MDNLLVTCPRGGDSLRSPRSNARTIPRTASPDSTPAIEGYGRFLRLRQVGMSAVRLMPANSQVNWIQ